MIKGVAHQGHMINSDCSEYAHILHTHPDSRSHAITPFQSAELEMKGNRTNSKETRRDERTTASSNNSKALRKSNSA